MYIAKGAVEMRFFVTLILYFTMIFAPLGTALAQTSLWVAYFGDAVKAMEKGNYVEAERKFRAAIRESREGENAKHPKSINMLADSLSGLSAALGEQRRFADAEAVSRKYVELCEMAFGESSPDYTVALNNLGLNLSEQKKYDEAEKIHRRALTLREQYDKPPRRNVAVSLLNIGKIIYEQGRYDEAESIFKQALQIVTSTPGEQATKEDIDTLFQTSENLYLVYVQQRKYEIAERGFKGLIEAIETRKGEMHPDLLSVLKKYAELLRQTDRTEQAAKLESRRRSIIRKME